MIERHGVRNRCGIYEKALPPGTLLYQAKCAREAGFDFLELAIDESAERMARLSWSHEERSRLKMDIAEAGAPIETVTLSAHRRYPWGSADADTRLRATVLAQQTIDLAADLGAKCVQIAGYFTFYEPTSPQSREWFVSGLKAAAEYASTRDVVLAMENMDGTDILSVSDALSVLEEVPSVRLYLDIGNLAGNNLPVLAGVAQALPFAYAIQLKDARPGEFRRVPFGAGTVPFNEVMALLQDAGYTGPMSVEMWNDEGDTGLALQTATWLKGLCDTRNPAGPPHHECSCQS